jgi:hypothetical protein
MQEGCCGSGTRIHWQDPEWVIPGTLSGALALLSQINAIGEAAPSLLVGERLGVSESTRVRGSDRVG